MTYVTIRIKGEDGHKQVDLTAERTVVGRAEDCDLPITHDSISRQHCAIVRVGEQWYLDDLGSSNGTRVNEDKIGSRVELKERDIIKIGKARLTFHSAARKERKQASSGVGLALDEEDLVAAGGAALVREIGATDPSEAVPCEHCGAWVSIAHRLAGDKMNCPACDRAFSVPQLVAATT